MIRILLAAAIALIATSAEARCIGTHIKTCWDQYGNSYTVNDLGNTTITNGYNSNTGSTWSQNSTTFGNTTVHNGTAADGDSWSITQQNFGAMKTYSGYDSDGNYVYKTCTQFGCY